MEIDHVQFYVDNAQTWANWFVRVFQFHQSEPLIVDYTQVVVVESADIRFVLLSPVSERSPLTAYQRQHPMGVIDIAFRVKSLDAAIARAQAYGATVLQAPQTITSSVGQLRWAKCQGWGDLCHTLVERRGITPPLPCMSLDTLPLGMSDARSPTSSLLVSAIDHVVLNVAKGDLQGAIAQYEAWYGFQRQQAFTIQTPRSGLCSQVLIHPNGTAQLPINEPTSRTSQIQEFLDINQGAGVQHVALKTPDILSAIAQLRSQDLSFISVPSTYYEQLAQHQDCPLTAQHLQAIAQAEILVDWQSIDPSAILWQTFTQPIFEKPTFFFEIIQRHTRTQKGDRYALGFGEGNFQALFEAIEREQLNRTPAL